MPRQDNSSSSKGRKKQGQATGENVARADEEVQIEKGRAVWMHERQTELESVFDKHDTLVREAFQMEKFVSLLAYDPKAAKQDNSAVFQEYQAKYDLVQQSTSAGPSRHTRKAQTERLQLLKGPIAGSTSTPKKATVTAEPDNTIWNIIASGKSKPRKLAVDVPVSTPKYSGRGKGKAKAEAEDLIQADLGEPATSQTLSSSHYRTTKRIGERAFANGVTPPPKRRKLQPSVSSFTAADPQPTSISPALKSRPLKRISTAPSDSLFTPVPKRTRHSQATGFSLSSAQNVAANADVSNPAKTPLPRIKLIVRRPDPSYSHPRQRPPPARHGLSLSALLSSYQTLGGQDVDDATLEEKARTSAKFWDRVDAIRRQGGLVPAPDSLEQDSRGMGSIVPHDQWADVVGAVKQHSRVDGRQVAAQIASKIRVYWEGQAVRDDKVKAQEEKRLRALAKATVRLVIAEWKRAVHHVREQERLRREAEERQRGHEHLDAILDQSGQILEAQQLDLSRAVPLSRSRSSSIGHWASQSPEPDDSDAEIEKNSDAGDSQDDRDSGEDEEPVDSAILLGEADHAYYISRRSRSASQSSMPPEEDVPDSDAESESAVSQDLLTGLPSSSPIMEPLSPMAVDIAGLEKRSHPPQISSLANSLPQLAVVEVAPHVNEGDQGSQPEGFPDTSREISPSSSTRAENRSLSKLEISTHGFPSDDLPEAMDDLALVSPRIPSSAGTRSPPATPSASAAKQPALEFQISPFPSSARDSAVLDARSDLAALPFHDAMDSPRAGLTPVDDAVGGSGAISVEMSSFEQLNEDGQDEEAEAQGDPAVADIDEDSSIPLYLRPYAVAPVEWDPQSPVKAPLLLRGTLRPYQQAGLEWLASLHVNNLNGILADEMGLGKTIQTISLLAHLACDRGIWGPHLIIVPTSVLLNWEMEFKKFLPGFKILSYHGNTKRRKELRQGWNNKYHFNVCVTSYTLASRDAHVFKRKPWYYMILDEAHMIKNFKSQRWNTLLMFRSFRRLLLTGTPLQNNLTELWALLQFLMSGTNFANLKEFGDWFSNPLEKAIEMGNIDDETQQRVAKLHTVLRPYLLRRLKRDVEKELPSKFEHLVMCPLSKRQRFLYDEFMARADTRYDLQSGVYQKIANILMQLRKVVNHPDLFEVRPIVTSFAMPRSAIADYEIKELLIRRDLLQRRDEECLNLDQLGLQFIHRQNTSLITALETRRLDGTRHLPTITEPPGEPPPYDTRTIDGYRRYRASQQRAATVARWSQIAYLNRLRCNSLPLYGTEIIAVAKRFYSPLQPSQPSPTQYLSTVDLLHSSIRSYSSRAEELADIVEKFSFATPAVVARDLPRIALSGFETLVVDTLQDPMFDAVLHRASVKLQIAFPDLSLLQYDCGKLQELARLLRERKAGGHRILIFTQMTKILDILEIFLNFHGYLYLRLDGATKIEDRQYITERFNTDSRIFCFIASSRSGGVGINLTGADTVIFYDSDFNPQMDRQCEDRAHRIGQIRDVHIYRFVSQHTVEEALLRKANQKRSLDDLVIQRGEFDWRTLFSDENALTKAMAEVEDTEDAHAAAVAASEEVAMEGADEADFAWEGATEGANGDASTDTREPQTVGVKDLGPHTLDPQEPAAPDEDEEPEPEDEEADEGGTTIDYMLAFVQSDMEYFSDWRI